MSQRQLGVRLSFIEIQVDHWPVECLWGKRVASSVGGFEGRCWLIPSVWRGRRFCHSQCTKLPLLRVMGVIMVGSLIPFFFGRGWFLDSNPTTCRFWWKTLTIAPRPNLWVKALWREKNVYVCLGHKTVYTSQNCIFLVNQKHFQFELDFTPWQTQPQRRLLKIWQTQQILTIFLCIDGSPSSDKYIVPKKERSVKSKINSNP